MKRKILAVSVCLSVLPSGAYAVDWSLNSTLSQTVELNDNEFLRQMLAGGTLGSYSTITTNATARTPTSKFSFDSDISYRKYFGGTEGIPTESFAGGVKMHYETTGKDATDRNYLDASWHRQSTAFALLGDLGVLTSARGFLDTTTVGGGLERSISALDFLALTARSSYTSFDPGTGGTPFVDTTASGTWRHRLNSITALTASSEIESLSFDNSLNTNIMILRENAGVEASLSPRLSFRGTAGMAYVQSERASPLLSITSVNAPSVSSAASEFITDMLLTYKMFPDTTLTLAGTQTVAPTVVGSLTKLSTVRAGLTYNVNSRQTLSLSADASEQTLSGTTSDFVSATIGYSYVLAREWNAQLTYRYLHRLPSSGTLVIDPVTGIPVPAASAFGAANSNSIMLVVSRSVSVLPNGY